MDASGLYPYAFVMWTRTRVKCVMAWHGGPCRIIRQRGVPSCFQQLRRLEGPQVDVGEPLAMTWLYLGLLMSTVARIEPKETQKLSPNKSSPAFTLHNTMATTPSNHLAIWVHMHPDFDCSTQIKTSATVSYLLQTLWPKAHETNRELNIPLSIWTRLPLTWTQYKAVPKHWN